MIEDKPMKVKGKVLPAPKLEYGSNKVMDPNNERKPGAWNLRNTVLLETHINEINNWGVVNFCQERDLRGMHPMDIIGSLVDGFKDCGLKCNGKPEYVDAAAGRHGMSALEAFQQLGQQIHASTEATTMDLFICLIPKVDKTLWKEIKVSAQCIVPVPSVIEHFVVGGCRSQAC